MASGKAVAVVPYSAEMEVVPEDAAVSTLENVVYLYVDQVVFCCRTAVEQETPDVECLKSVGVLSEAEEPNVDPGYHCCPWKLDLIVVGGYLPFEPCPVSH
jgi:hypothetical protein